MAPHLTQRARNLSVAVVILVLIGLSAFQAVNLRQSREEFADYKKIIYKRCLEITPGNDSANAFRQVEIEVFARFAQDPTIPADRQQYYQELASRAREAVSSYRPANCSIYR